MDSLSASHIDSDLVNMRLCPRQEAPGSHSCSRRPQADRVGHVGSGIAGIRPGGQRDNVRKPCHNQAQVERLEWQLRQHPLVCSLLQNTYTISLRFE